MSDRAKIYVGSLGNNATEREIYDAFSYYGPIRNVWVARRPPGFAFVIYEDPRDAEDAVRSMDGRFLCGRRVTVELSHGRSRWPTGGPPDHVLRKDAPQFISEGRRRERTRSRSRDRRRSRSPRRRSGSRRKRGRSRSRSKRSRSHS